MRALCVGDLHAGAGPDLGRLPGERLAEQEQVWSSVLALARETDCDVILNAGDIFDKRKPSPDEILAVERPLVAHREASGCPIYGIVGNHEVSGVSLGTVPEALGLAGLWSLSTEPAIHRVCGVSLCLLPWAPVSRIVAAQDGGDRDDVNAYAAELLVQTARGLRAKVDGPAILLTHFSISGAKLPTGLPVDQIREPVLEWGDLDAIGFDAVIAGHIHAPQVFGRDETAGLYVGSPMPLSFGETGTDHGCWIVEPDTLSGAYVPRFIPIESRRLVTLDRELVADAAWPPTNETMIADAIVRARIRASQEEARRFDVAAFKRELVENLGAYKVASVQLDVEREERARVEGLTDDLDEVAAFNLWMDAEGLNGEQAAALRERLEARLGLVRA